MTLRQERLGDAIRDVVANLFLGGRLSDPRLTGVTITACKLTADLQMAYIYFRLFDKKELAKAQRALERTKNLLKQNIAHELKIKKIPDLRFFYDESIETGARIEELIHQIKTQDN